MGGAEQAKANVEFKARCRDLAEALRRAEAVATERLGLDHQVDTYFATRSGRLKLRESSLSGGQLVPYLRPDLAGPRRSDYRVIPVDDPAGTKRLLAEILGIECVVEKEREILLYENVRIHLDRVAGLGDFLELEAVFDGTPAAEAEQDRKIAFLRKELGVRDEDLVPVSYENLVREKSG
ncbi:MAG: class IV adenylate cyclase [Myxococcota bacterium]|nr:class IV adenylate cyclase [Myxococcota bacterium]